MITDFLTRIKGPQLFLSLIFLALGLMVLVFSVKGYKDYSQQEIKATDVSGRSGPDITSEDFLAMLDSTGEASGVIFEVVSQKNLFSPDREAWEPPPASDDQEEKKTSRTQGVNPKDFKLYGITTSRDEKMALVYYQRFPENNRNRLVTLGETVYHDRIEGSEAFKVVMIDIDSVTLEAGGDSFQVGLFSHERQVVQTTDQDRISVVIGGTTEPVGEVATGAQDRPAPSPGPEGSERKTSDTETGSEQELPEQGDTDAERDPEDEEAQTRPASSLPELLQRMKQGSEQGQEQQDRQQHIQEMEEQVQQGTMRRVDSPFGPIYRPVQ